MVSIEEDKQFKVVVEAIRQIEVMHRNDMDIDFDANAILTQQRILFDQNKEFREKIYMLEEKMKLLKEDDKGVH
ncbi:unnamed protein product [Trifolium pratense]|uniref:Uncharacterized protein n=1 Tax=Trifolium pratense TaxID=57577 RepID=A0ACB0I8C5_TRIPR|nr:unnamed protein product [Trifolium pratense]